MAKKDKYSYEPEKVNWLWEPFRITLFWFFTTLQWIWDNLIWFPSGGKKRFGVLRLIFYGFLLTTNVFGIMAMTSTLAVFFGLFLVVQLFIGFFQMIGVNSSNSTWQNNGTPIYQKLDYGPTGLYKDGTWEQRYPKIKRWFDVRDSHLGSLKNEEKARFFIQTGGLTEAGIVEMEKHPNTRRALEKLNFELSRPPKEMIEFMQGKKI